MPIKLIKCSETPLCYGFKWEIENETKLVELVAKLMLGHYRHVQKILYGDEGNPCLVSNNMIDEIIRRLEKPSSEPLRYHRDGWVFQMISWVAARIADPNALTKTPHSQPAEKGFDNIIVEVQFDNNSVAGVFICEDKATENSRDTIRDLVWPEIEDFESGRRDCELLPEVTAILERCHQILDPDKCIKDIFWNKVRRYRISVTTDKVDNTICRRKLFKDFDEKAPGAEIRRRAETIHIARLRNWMDDFCDKINQYLVKQKCITQ